MPQLELPNGQMHQVGTPVEEVPVNTTEALADAQAALEEGTATEVPEPQGPLPCITAFVVYQLPDGRWQIADDLDVPLVPERKPHGDDFTSGCATALRDVQTQEFAAIMAQAIGPSIIQNTVNNVLNNLPKAMMQFGQTIRDSAEANKVRQQLEKEQQARGGR